MPDVSIKVMSMNPKREYSIEIKGLDQEQLPDYVSKTYRDLIDLLGAEQIDIKVDNDSKKLLLEDEYQDHIGGVIKTDLRYKP